MSDLRSLMKAQKASNRIQHPYARYSNAGALSCSLCSLPLKSEVLWPSHLTSKTHRSNLKKQKEQEEQQLSAAQAHAEASSSSNSGLKRPAEADEDESGKRARLDGENDVDGDDAPSGPASFLPAGFFSNPEAANGPQGEDAEAGLSAAGDEPIDEEWAAFEATLNKAEDPVASTSTATGYTTAATITAQPVLFEEEQDNEEGKADGEAGDGEEEDDEEPKETEEERREREEREELMERIETEEREQQEADERVDALKKRLLAVKSARKAGGPVSGKNGSATAQAKASSEPTVNGVKRGRRNRW